ncbi:MAG: DUF72 domain-containing protein [Candidatus Thermoplasmatota archaeon]
MILIGTSGWSHAAWVGPFYPVSLRDASDEWLAYYASRFQCVELSSTFDALPGEDLVADWCRQGIDLANAGYPFEFSLKMPREVTHDALAKGDVQRAWELAARFERQVLDPLSDEGLLGAVLVQLPPRLEPHSGVLHTLTEALSALAGRSVAIELRDPAWVTSDGHVVDEALDLFRSPDVCLAELDGPSMPNVASPSTARHSYVRFHGRREDRWRNDTGATDKQDGARYDHLYSTEELAPWASHAAKLEADDRIVRMFFNNTPHAQAAVNAVEMLHLLGEGQTIPRPRLTKQTQLPG